MGDICVLRRVASLFDYATRLRRGSTRHLIPLAPLHLGKAIAGLATRDAPLVFAGAREGDGKQLKAAGDPSWASTERKRHDGAARIILFQPPAALQQNGLGIEACVTTLGDGVAQAGGLMIGERLVHIRLPLLRLRSEHHEQQECVHVSTSRCARPVTHRRPACSKSSTRESMEKAWAGAAAVHGDASSATCRPYAARRQGEQRHAGGRGRPLLSLCTSRGVKQDLVVRDPS